MKVLIALLAVAGLSGCAAYGVPYGSADVYYSSGSPYYGGYYGYGAPVVVDPRPTYIYGGHGYGGRGYGHGRGYRDRDGDGIPNRYDRDRDGDGVPNRRDAYPNNPRRQ